MFILATTEGLPMAAPVMFHIGPLQVNNSMIVSLVVAVGLIVMAQIALRQPALVPGTFQNIWETLIEGLANLLEGILGWKLLQSTFWFFATIFIFIVACNLQALIPGVGTIGSGYGEHWWDLEHITMPWMRGANADVTMTLAMSLIFFALWIYWAFKFNGPLGVLKHLFGSQAKLGGILGLFVGVIFFFVGFIEVVSILVRPISLTFRLYGNIYGGEAMIDQIKHMTGYGACLALIPVYIFELLVAVVQALVFCLLTAVFTAIMCKHDDHDDKGGSGHH